MAITYMAASAFATGQTSVAVAHPTVSGGILAGDLLVIAVGCHPDTPTFNTPAGWTSLGTISGGTGAAQGADTGNTRSHTFYRIAAGGETGTVSVTLTGASGGTSGTSVYGVMLCYRNNSGQWSIAAATGVDSTTGTTWSVAYSSNPGLMAGDHLVLASVISTDTAPSSFTSDQVTATGATIAAPTVVGTAASTTGVDIGGRVSRTSVSSGTATAAPTHTITLGSGTNYAGPESMVRLREVPTLSVDAATQQQAADGVALVVASPLGQLSDNFASASLDTTKWPGSYGDASVVGGRARIGTTSATWSGIKSATSYILAGSSVSARVYPPANTGGTISYLSILVTTTTAGTDAGFNIDTASGGIGYLLRTGFSDPSGVFDTYDPVAHAYVRLSEAGGTLTWEVSPDGVNWTTRRTAASPSWAGDSTSAFVCESHRDAGIDNFAEIDDVNLAPTVLSVDAATQAQTTDSVTLTSAAVDLTIANASQAQTTDAVTLTQSHVLSVDAATQAQTTDAVTLTQSHVLSVDAATQAHTADAVTLTQSHVLSVDAATQAQTTDGVTLLLGGISLTVADAVQLHTSSELTLGQLHHLAVNAATQALTSTVVPLGGAAAPPSMAHTTRRAESMAATARSEPSTTATARRAGSMAISGRTSPTMTGD